MASTDRAAAQFASNDSDIFSSEHYSNPSAQRAFLYANACVRFAFGLFAFLSNAFIVHITRRYKNDLKSTSCYLLAINALCDAIVAASTLITFLLTAIDVRVTIAVCLWLNALPEIAFNTTFVLVFFIAMDRLVAVFLPLWYRTLPIKCYISAVSALAFAIGILIFAYAVITNMDTADQIMFKCSIADFWLGDYGTAVQYSSLALTLPAIACYLAILLKIRHNSVAPIQPQIINRGILRSLLALVLLILAGWILGIALRWFIPWAIDDRPVAIGYVLMSVSDLLLTFHGTASGIVLYFCSGDYRRIMRKEFVRILKAKTSSTTTVQHISVAAANPAQQHSQTTLFFTKANNTNANRLAIVGHNKKNNNG